jgi:hypothetical protein
MFWVDVATETKMVLDAFPHVIGDGFRGVCGCVCDCHFVADVSFFDVDRSSGSLASIQELQEMGRQQARRGKWAE